MAADGTDVPSSDDIAEQLQRHPDSIRKEQIEDELVTIEEGSAKIQMPKSNKVFYNPVQHFNRDLTVAVIRLAMRKHRDKAQNRDRPTNGADSVTRNVDKVAEKTSGEKGQCGSDQSGVINDSREIHVEGEGQRKIKEKDQYRVLDALSATGLRALRYALEIPEIDQVIANDISQPAVESIERNIKFNNVIEKVKASKGDAGLLMYQSRFPPSKRFKVIDLDPYGSPAQFLDAAIQSVDEGGLLCVTCTDMAGLCGNHGEASFAKYGAMPLHAKFCHEMALRLVLGSLERHATRYKRYIVPLLSVSADFYIRLFVLVYTSASEVKRSASKQSLVYLCNGCESFHLQAVGKKFEDGNRKKYSPGSGPVVNSKCSECGHKFSVGGPVWSEPIHQHEFVLELLENIKQDINNYKTSTRLIGTLSLASEELVTSPLYYIPDRLANIIHCSTPSLVQFKSALLHLGYEVSGSHANSNAVKTNAPSAVVWDVLRCWEQLHPVKREKLSPNSPAVIILGKETQIQPSFKHHPGAVAKSQKSGMVRYPKNPEVNWGPKARAKGSSKYKSLEEKRKRLQCKRTQKQDPLYLKQFSCKRFKEGACQLGDQCRYSHDLSISMEGCREEDMPEKE